MQGLLHLDCVTGSVVGPGLSGLRQPGDVTGSWQGITGIPPPDGMVIILTVMCLSEKAPIPASKRSPVLTGAAGFRTSLYTMPNQFGASNKQGSRAVALLLTLRLMLLPESVGSWLAVVADVFPVNKPERLPGTGSLLS